MPATFFGAETKSAIMPESGSFGVNLANSDSKKTNCWCGGWLAPSVHEFYGKCRDCGTLVLRRSPSEAELKSFYGYQEYWHKHQTTVSGYPAIEQRAENDFRDRIPIWHRLLASHHPNPDRVLEFGCAHGGFLHYCAQRGSSMVVGVEVDESTCQFARKNFGLANVVSGLFPDVPLPFEQFDAVCSFDVIEHFLDPVRAITRVSKLLAPGGICLFQTPCYRGEESDWKQFRPQEHTFLYTEQSIRRLFKQCGLEAMEIIPGYFPDDMFVIGRLNVLLEPSSVSPGTECRNQVPDKSVQRLLWVRTDSIGDAVLASAMLEPLRKKYPGAKIAVLCQQHVADLYTACPFVDSIICYDRKKVEADDAEREQIVSEIAAFQPDLILNSVRSRDVFSNELTLAFRAARHVAIESDLDNISEADREKARAGYQVLIPTAGAHKTELARHADFLHGLGIESLPLQPAVWTSPEDEALADAYFQKHKLNPAQTIAVFPGAQYQMRVYHGYADVLKQLEGFTFLIFGDVSQNSLGEKLEQHMPGRAANLCGRTTLREAAALLRRCRLYVGAESSGAHLACAVGVPNVVLLGGGHFGRFMPYSPLTSAVVLPLECFGCNWRCSHKHVHCVKDLSAEVLSEAIRQTLERQSQRARVFLQTASSWTEGIKTPAWQRPDCWLAGSDVEIIELETKKAVGRGTAKPPRVPLVSAIVSTYKSERFIRGCLQDLIDQTLFRHDDMEIIVVDSNSPESEGNIVEEFKRQHANITYVRTPTRETIYAAWNRGILMARGQYVTNANTDDRHRPDALELMANFLNSHSEVALVYADQLISEDANDTFATAKATARWGWPEFSYEELERRCIIGPQPMWRRSLHEKHGFFQAELRSAGDYEFWLRIGKTEILHRMPEILGVYYNNPGGDENSGGHTARETQQLRERYGMVAKKVAATRTIPVPITRAELAQLPFRAPDLMAGNTLGLPLASATIPMQSPLVSVIVSTYNRPERLVEALHSILDQTFKNFEIIVVNDAGCDVAAAVAQLNSGQIVCLRHENNQGVAAARNTGLKAARGKLIAYLDDDDLYHPNHLEVLIRHWQSTGDAVVYSDSYRAVQRKEGDRYVTVDRTVLYSHDWDGDKILVHNFVPTLCIMHEKRCLEEVGGFDESLKTHEDWDLWIRMSRRFNFSHLKEVTCEFRLRDDSASLSTGLRTDFLRTADVIYKKSAAVVANCPDIRHRRQQHFLEVSRAMGNVPGKPTPDCLVVSIVIPVFNRLDMTRPCLEAIQRETVSGTFEIIVVDNASSDGTREFLAAEQTAGRLRTIRNDQNLGFSKACNQGIRAARGGFILLLNNDTVPLAGWLEAMLDEIVVSAQIGAVGSCLLYPGGELIQHAGVQIGGGGGMIHPYHCWRLQRLDRVPLAGESRDCQVVTGACVLIRRTVLDEVSLLDEEYINGFEDVDLCFRIRQARHRIRYCAKSRVIHHESMTPGRSQHEQANYQRLNARWKSIIKPDETPAETALQTTEILCRERLLTEPENPCALAALAQICSGRKDVKQAGEWHAQLMKVTRNGKAVPVFVSIVIPVLNNLTLTKKCVEAIERAGGLVSAEIIVVDNASTDGTPEFLREARRKGRLTFIHNATNQGFARACNQGAAQARASVLLFLNNDTVPLPGWIDALLAAAKQPEVGIVGAKLLYANNTIQHAGIGWINGVPDHPHRHAQPNAPEVNSPRELDMVTGACLMIHRDLFLQLAGFDEVYRNGVEDIDLCLRVRAAGRKVVYEPKAVVYHLEGQSAGRFNHVNENLKLFFSRWGKLFDGQKKFIMPAKPESIMASQSILLTTQPAGTQPVAAKNVVVSWEGSFLDHGSLSHVNRELVGALKEFPAAQIKCVTNGATIATDAPTAWPEFAAALLTSPAPDAAITVRHAWPPNWQRPHQGKLVVIQPWEFGALPEQWVQQARVVDEFWIPSEYVRHVYIESGVPKEKVFVVPNGVATEKFNPQAAPMKLATPKKFKFLFVGGTIGRKGPDLLLQAFLKNFTAADDVCLVIKDFGGKSVYAGQTFEAQIRAAQAQPNAPEILYLNEEFAPEQLPRLYTACDCLVMPYRGEGFGLPVLEAMACGLPLIVTAGGATDDFVRDEFAWRIPAERKVFGQEVSGMKLVNPGWLLEPNLVVLGGAMRTAFGNPTEARRRGQLASRHAQNWSWKNSAAMAAKRIQALVANQAAPAKTAASAPAPLPAVAAMGNLVEARELFAKKSFEAAWASVLVAIAKRPFHPEAYFLLAEIALAASDGKIAKQCAQRARDLAPGWNLPKQFLSKPLKGDTKSEWLLLPEVIGNRLTVCVLTKNEEKFIAQCLQSVRGLASQIVVLDTGSTDRTVEIAREHGAEVHSLAWAEDFSAARNAALEHATGDWILTLDADEELPVEQHLKLLADLKQTSAVAFRLPLVNRGQEAEGRSFIPRLFRNLPGAYYYGRIHEQVFQSFLPLAQKWGLKTALGTAELLHHGYTMEMIRDRNKVERNLNLLRQATQEYPADANLVMNFGLELVRSGDLNAGLEKYREAFELMSAQPAADVVPELREALLTQFVCQFYKVQGHAEVVRVLSSPLAKNGGLTASLHLSFGLSQFELKNYPAAAEQMRSVLAKRKQPALTPINLDIHSAAPLHCLALCLARMDDLKGAEKAFNEAVAATGRTNEARVDFAKFLVEQGRPTEALQTLHTGITADAQCVAAWRLGGEIALGSAELLEFASDWTGEAFRALPENPVIAAQRAEALMLNGDVAAAGELWEKIWSSEPDPRPLAALILCETITAPTAHAPHAGQDEQATSTAFIAWYQKLLTLRATGVTERLNEQLETLSRALPTAARMLETALSEAAVPAQI